MVVINLKTKTEFWNLTMRGEKDTINFRTVIGIELYCSTTVALC